MKQPLCTICGLPNVLGGICSQCKINRPSYNLLRSWAVYSGPVQKAIHRIKYKHDFSLGFELARYVFRFVDDMNLFIEGVIPVPLGKKRFRDRGYNQVSMVALPLALKLRIKYMPYGLIRIRETESQVGLNIKDRINNVKDAFLANSHQVSGKNILLIDDVATTGATLTSCANALRMSGASNVFAITLARALGSHGLSYSKGN